MPQGHAAALTQVRTNRRVPRFSIASGAYAFAELPMARAALDVTTGGTNLSTTAHRGGVYGVGVMQPRHCSLFRHLPALGHCGELRARRA